MEYPPCRKLIDSSAPVAIATDFNPNAFCCSLPFVMNLAAVQMKMTLNEALVAATLNAAAALDKADKFGSIEIGKSGDFVVVDAPKWEHLIYELGGNTDTISSVIKRGKVVMQL